VASLPTSTSSESKISAMTKMRTVPTRMEVDEPRRKPSVRK
jgi:hypothetical protein